MNDEKFLHGTARFVDDIELPGLLHAAIVRSQVAHGTIRRLDTGGVETSSGAVVLGPEEIRARALAEVPVVVAGEVRQVSRPLVSDRVRFVGEPVGIAVAGSRYEAEDAAERCFVEVDDLHVVPDAEAALTPGAPLLYPEWGTNVVAEMEGGDDAGRTDEVFRAADAVLRTVIRIGRLAGVPMECRGIVAAPDLGTHQLTVWTSTQAPHMVKDVLAAVTGLSHHLIRVVGPDVGGGFGLKDHIYEDELLVCLAALDLGRPVKWIEDRRESLTVTTQARDHRHEVAVAYDDDGTLRGLRTHGVRDTGAYLTIFGPGPQGSLSANLPGPYRWEAVRSTAQVVVSNRAPLGAYRGFGQPQAAVLRERAVDLVAEALDMDPVGLRLRNMITSDELPYRTRMLTRFESGDYPSALRRAAEIARSWPEPPGDGRARGIGYSSYVEMCAVGPAAAAKVLGEAAIYETATVRMEVDGSVRIVVGTSPHGQGHETTFAQLAADRLGVAVEHIALVHSDTDVTPYSSYGTAASRSMALAGGAIVRAADRLADKIRRIAGDLLEAAADDVVLAEGRAAVAGTVRSVPLRDVALRAWRGFDLPEGDEPGLSETFVHDPEDFSFSYASHACRVAVDRDTGHVDIERFAVVHDCGTIVNPTIVEGQIHGGVAQGVGAALLEEVEFSDSGAPLSSTFMDYLLPVSSTIPDIDVEHTEHPSPFIPGGMKGMGEGGTIGATAAVMNAIARAVPEVSGKVTETPVTPTRLWTWLHADHSERPSGGSSGS